MTEAAVRAKIGILRYKRQQEYLIMDCCPAESLARAKKYLRTCGTWSVCDLRTMLIRGLASNVPSFHIAGPTARSWRWDW